MTRTMQMRLLPVLAGLLLCSPASADIVNGSFEDGLNGWTVVLAGSGDASAGAVVSHTGVLAGEYWTPTDGAHFALLKTDGNGSVTSISQTFEVQAGQQLRFNMFFDAGDYLPWNDWGQAVLTFGSTNDVLYQTSVQAIVDADGPNYGSDDLYWKTPFIYNIGTAGTYTLTFKVANVGDNALDSFVGVDKVELATIPVPGAALLGVMGLSLVGWVRRRTA